MLGILGLHLKEWFPVCKLLLMKVRRVRLRSFQVVLRQNAAFFDRDEHSTGALTRMLGQEATAMSGLSGINLGSILTMISGLLISCVVGYNFYQNIILKVVFVMGGSCPWSPFQFSQF